MGDMNVNFNNVRKRAIYVYEDLVEKLNRSIIKNDDQYAVPNGTFHGNIVNIKGYVLVDSEDIKKQLDELRSLLGVIAMTHIEGDEEFKDVFDEVFPEDEEDCMSVFNEEF